MKCTVTTYLPLARPLRVTNSESEFERKQSEVNRFIDELGNTLDIMEENHGVDTVAVVEVDKILPFAQMLSLHGASSTWLILIQICSTIEFDQEEVDTAREDDGFQDSFTPYFAAGIVSQHIVEIYTILDLAFPGCLNFKSGIAICDHAHQKIAPKTCLSVNFFDEDRAVLEKPTVRSLPLIDCVEWARRMGFSQERHASTPVSRALASFTQATHLGHSTDQETLFRMMQGLEAFYCRGHGDLRNQLSENGALWLGDWGAERKMIGKLYDLRSKFVHGVFPIEYYDCGHDMLDYDHKTVSDQELAGIFAARLLLATLQKCIIKNVQEIEWLRSIKIKPYHE